LTPAMFTDLQDALIYIYAPAVLWLLALGVALGVFSSILWLWFTLMGTMTRKR